MIFTDCLMASLATIFHAVLTGFDILVLRALYDIHFALECRGLVGPPACIGTP
jgi:hypothetical protein